MGFVTSFAGSFNAGDAGSLAVVTPTSRAIDVARCPSQIEGSEKLNGERGEARVRAKSLCLEGATRDGAEPGVDRVLRPGKPSFSFCRLKS